MALVETALAFDAAAEARQLDARFADASATDILAAAIGRLGSAKIAAVSSFGTESAVLLHMIAGIDQNVPVIFIDTGKHFGETRAYRDRLVEILGLTNAKVARPDPAGLKVHDADGMLFNRDADRCCDLRKSAPLQRALAPYRAWITGRKRFQTTKRAGLKVFEEEGGRIKVNPLAGWDVEAITAYAAGYALPAHPLAAQGFRSIGCMPCTSRTLAGEDPRAGRWRGGCKTECGIHLPGYEQDNSGI